MQKPIEFIIAHRGESYDAPENTLASINLAWERGAKAVEVDIQLTYDNEIVVFHDKDTARLAGNKLKIKKSTLRELSALDIGSYKAAKWKNERIPSLKNVLKTVPKDCKLIIEIKSDSGILSKLKYELSNSKLDNSQIEIIDFNINTLSKAKALMPNYKMLWLLDLDYFLPWYLVWINKNRIIQSVKKHNLDGVDVWAGKILNRNFIQAFKMAGLLVYTWTVNNPLNATHLLDAGIDGVTTDRAEWMTKELDLE